MFPIYSRKEHAIGAYAFGYTEAEPDDEETADIVRSDGFKIYCFKDSAAQQYAVENGFDYEILDESDSRIADVNGDGTIDIEDAVMVIGHVNGQKALTDEESVRADIDGNSVIDIEDAVAIIAHVNGIKALF